MSASRTSPEAKGLEHAHGLIAEEQAALRRVATLVAAGAPPNRVFESVTAEVGRLIGTDAASMTRFEPGREITPLGLWNRTSGYQRVGRRYRCEPGMLATLILETGLPARVNLDSGVGSVVEFAREQGWRSSVGAPVIVDGHIWGLIAVASTSTRVLPADTESRLAKFSELVGTAVSNAKRSEDLTVLAREQAALRRVATLVARGVPPADVFAAVAREVGQLLGVDATHLGRYESDDSVVAMANWSRGETRVVAGTRMALTGGSVTERVRLSGRPARMDDYEDASGRIADTMRELGLRSSVGVPILVEGRLWGVVVVSTKGDDPLPSDTEARTAAFTELVATAIANSESRREAVRLTEEQAGLRRVATLVAREASPTEIFGAVAVEIAQILRTDAVGMLRFEPDDTATLVAQSDTPWDPPPLGTSFTLEGENVVASVFRTRQAARLDDWTNATGPPAAMAHALGIRSSVATPIIVEGRLWGTMIAVTARAEPHPADTESRLAEFTELLATAISNAEARGELAQLAEEQAALRRVATLVAHETSQAEVFTAVAEELGRVMGVQDIRMVRYDDVDDGDGSAVVVASWGSVKDVLPVGERRPLGGHNVTSLALRTGRPARLDDYASASGAIGERVRSGGVQSAVAVPITVEGRIWGAMIAASIEGDPLAADIEPRLTQFTELMGTAIANTEARAQVARLADEQAALRRVATLVAKESPPQELFAKVAEEVACLLGTDIDSAILRYEEDETATVVAVWGDRPRGGIRVDARLRVNGSGVAAKVFAERCPVRVDNYSSADGAIAGQAQEHGIRAAVGCPILVRDRLWGAMVVARYEPQPFAADTERRVAQFTELVATAISNTEARSEVERLADEQAALRRVATLAAEGGTTAKVFDAVVSEVSQMLEAAQVGLMRSEAPGEVSILAMHSEGSSVVRAGMRLPLDGDSVTAQVLRTGRSARLNVSEYQHGTIAQLVQEDKVTATVGAPLVVEGDVWGAITATWIGQKQPPVDAEARLTEFAELLDTAIANADSRDQLTASRARVLTAGDEARRRVVRDLHDGAQQRLVHTIVTLKLARRALSEDRQRSEKLLAEALDQAEQGNAELRELAHGILPSVLTRGGLLAGVEAVVDRLELPVHVDVTSRRLPPEIEASAYFIVAEALTNVVKHSHAARVKVTAAVDNDMLRIQVRDDGRGGADLKGHGLLGIRDRAAALGGNLRIISPRGEGTVVTAELPLSP